MLRKDPATQFRGVPITWMLESTDKDKVEAHIRAKGDSGIYLAIGNKDLKQLFLMESANIYLMHQSSCRHGSRGSEMNDSFGNIVGTWRLPTSWQ